MIFTFARFKAERQRELLGRETLITFKHLLKDFFGDFFYFIMGILTGDNIIETFYLFGLLLIRDFKLFILLFKREILFFKRMVLIHKRLKLLAERQDLVIP